MKYIFELILTTVVIFFLWNILKRMFFSTFYKFPKDDNSARSATPQKNKRVESQINWDAETVDYEEIKENSDHKK